MEILRKYWIGIVLVFGVCGLIKPALCGLIIGLILSFVGFSSLRILKKLKDQGIESTGKIIEYQVSNKGYKTPVIEFKALNGEIILKKPYIYASTDISIIRSYSSLIGTTVSILYDPEDPKKFVLKGEEGFNYGVLILIILIGLVCIGFSFCVLFGFIKIGK